MAEISLEQIRERVRATRGPQFMLPARFEGASFDNYEVDPAYPRQSEAVEQIQRLISRQPESQSIWPWRRRSNKDDGPRGIYLDGKPGIGKTHLLAAAFQSAEGPKLFATFDEFSAAAGTLGMEDLRRLLSDKHLVCIDEIDLRDPANIMLLTSLVRAMLAGKPRIIATANADPTVMPGTDSMATNFARELGEIAEAFQILSIDGVDWRESGMAPARPAGNERNLRVLHISWDDLLNFLQETHPMYDAAWLQEVDLIALDRIEKLPDTDRALRFVRLIDRVYDRDVALKIEQASITPEELLQPVRDDRRFTLHYARCHSRLVELTGGKLAGIAD